MIAIFKRSLSFQMLVAALLGAFLGLFLGDLCSVFAPWENAYILILKITTVPYLICAVMHGIGRLTFGEAKNILQKGVLFISGVWAINILTIYTTVYVFPTSKGVSYSAYSNIEPSSINFAELLIPSNIFAALSNNLIPAVVIFGLLIGISLMYLKEKQPLIGMLDILVNSMATITGWISRITPIGTFLIIADRVGSMQPDIFKQIGTYLVLYILSISLLVFWVFPRIVEMLTSISAGKWLKSLGPLLLVAFTTNLVIVTLPFLIELIKREIEHHYGKEETLGDQVQGIVSVIFNLPLGSLFITVFIFFISTFYNTPIAGESQIQLFLTTFLTSLGAIGLGSWINSLNFLLDTLGLPLTAVDTYITTLPFTAGFQSMISVMEIATLSLLIALSSHRFLKWNFAKAAKHTVVICIPVILLTFAFKNWIKLPPIANPTKGIRELSIHPPVKTRLYKAQDALPAPRSGDPFDRIIASKVLRVGYNPETLPFCFYNEKQELVGYDIYFAYTLAKDLQCDLELIPMQFGSIAEELNQGLYDIAMSSVSINEERLRLMGFSNPYLESRMAFVMRKKFKKIYTSLDAIARDPQVKLVVRRGTAYEHWAKRSLPSSKIAVIDNYQDYINYYPNDILLRGEFQLISWSLSHPNFSVVIPNPLIAKDVFGYGVALGSDKLICYLNRWLDLKKSEMLPDEQFNIWVLGRDDSSKKPERRWSIIRDVFGWTDN